MQLRQLKTGEFRREALSICVGRKFITLSVRPAAAYRATTDPCWLSGDKTIVVMYVYDDAAAGVLCTPNH